jgi:Putative prokaryotic signal transducing protein
MDTKDLVTVYTLTDPVRAEIIRAGLQGQGIRCFLDGLNTAELASIGAFGIKVQVPAGDADRASRFIECHAAKRTGSQGRIV